MPKGVVEKLLIKPGRAVAFVDPPAGYVEGLGALPEGATIEAGSAAVDLLQVFVRSQRELEVGLAGWKARVKPGGILWVSYPKLTSALRSDLNRDTIWAFARTAGMEGVAMVALDDDWSAMRLKMV